jgi:hypothetical protein
MDSSGPIVLPDPTEINVSADQFLRSLSESGIVPIEELPAIVSSLSPEQRDNADHLAAAFVGQDKLTSYQAALLQRGQTTGLVLGNYVILDQLGAGGMGQVFKAQHRRMKRTVALKVLPPRMTSSPAAVQRFQREVEAVARLSHPNIVAAHDADEAQGVHFLVMECVDGQDLARLVKNEGPLPVPLAVDCIIQAARGLAHAHEAGIVHRDIKPGNLLRDRQGVVKVLDLGLARFADAPGPANPAADLTENGSILGTCDYMAPEQALDTRRADQRSDVYSLGCSLYFLLAGRHVYDGETSMEKVFAHRETPIPSLRAVRSDVPRGLDKVFGKMLAKEADNRYPSMNAVIAALEPFTKVRPPGAAPSRLLIAALMLVVGLVGFAAIGIPMLLLNRPEPPRAATGPARPAPAAVVAPTVPISPSGVGVRAPITSRKESLPVPLDQEIARLLKERNPGFNGVIVKAKYERDDLVELEFCTENVTDLSPLQKAPRLKDLRCLGGPGESGSLTDLSGLKGLTELWSLVCYGNPKIKSFAPLQGSNLHNLNCSGIETIDLRELQKLPMANLYAGTKKPLTDLSGLRGMTLASVGLNIAPGTDLGPLRDMPILHTINNKPKAVFLDEFSRK